MATKKPVNESLLNFDISEYKRQKALIEQHASKGIAERVANIKTLLQEISDLVEISGVELKLGGSYGELSSLIEAVDEKHPEWNSSSYDC